MYFRKKQYLCRKFPVKNEIQTIKRRKRDEINTKLNTSSPPSPNNSSKTLRINFFGQNHVILHFMQIYLQIPNNFPNSKFAYFRKKQYLCGEMKNTPVRANFQIGLLAVLVACLTSCASPTVEEYYRQGREFHRADQCDG